MLDGLQFLVHFFRRFQKLFLALHLNLVQCLGWTRRDFFRVFVVFLRKGRLFLLLFLWRTKHRFNHLDLLPQPFNLVDRVAVSLQDINLLGTECVNTFETLFSRLEP